MHSELLVTLHDHLSSGHLYATDFDIRVYKSVFTDSKKNVIHKGCAIGECVYIFSESWGWLYDKTTVHIGKSEAFLDFPYLKSTDRSSWMKYQSSVMKDVATFFDIPQQITYILFDTWLLPKGTLSLYLKKRGFVPLNNNSNPYDIIKNIEACLYLTDDELNHIAKMWLA